MSLKNKSALITGSTSGIGLGVARYLAKNGVNIALNGFGDKQEIEDIRKSIEIDFDVKAIYNGADMSKPQEIADFVAEASGIFDGIDILVNNAGIQHVSPIDEFDGDKWDSIIAINLSSNFHTIKAVAPSMKKKGWGRIINIASIHGLIASPYKAAYISAKHGQVGLTKASALDLAQFGITVNAICPGYVRTPLVEAQIKPQAIANNISEEEVIEKILLKNHAIKDFVKIEDIAEMILFLCSNSAKIMTGTALPIDGGWSAQ